MAKYRVAVAGCGNMANTWVDYGLQREDVEIVAMVDIIEGKAESMAKRKGIKCYTALDINDAIEDAGANLVFNVTTPEAHIDIVRAGLKHGCDVLGEKPMAVSMDEAFEMIELNKKSRKMYTVMQNRRYLKQIRAYRDLVLSGEIGDMGYICADFFLGPHFGGFRDLMDSPLILDMAIHTFDQARFITGQNPVSVYCHEFNPKGSWYKGNAAAVCIFEFEDGSVFCYRGSWCAEGCPTSWEASWRAMGSHGTAIWDGNNMPFAECAVPSNENKFMNELRRIESTCTWDGREGHFGCFDEMFSALSEGREAETDCKDNIMSIAMVFGAMKSAREGRKVFLNEL